MRSRLSTCSPCTSLSELAVDSEASTDVESSDDEVCFEVSSPPAVEARQEVDQEVKSGGLRRVPRCFDLVSMECLATVSDVDSLCAAKETETVVEVAAMEQVDMPRAG